MWKWVKNIRRSYKFREDLFPDAYSTPIMIKRGPYKGVVYCYGQVMMKNVQGSAIPGLHFKYNVLDYAGLTISDTPHFINVIGDILTDIMIRPDIEMGKTDHLGEEETGEQQIVDED